MQTLNLDFLRTFVAVIEQGSFSAAAVRLNLTQPAVSLQIRQLEKRLDVQLIERVGRTARPTAAGSELLIHAAKIEAAVLSAFDAVAPHQTGASGRVRLGTGATVCTFLLPPVLRDLRELYPGLEIAVTTGNTPDMVKAVEENVLDLGLVILPAAGRSLDVTPILDEEFVAIAPPAMVLPARLTAVALAQQPLVLFEQSGNTRRVVDEWFAASGVPLKPIMSLGSVEAIKEMVSAGLGCAVLPRLAVQKEIEAKTFVVRSLTPNIYRQIALVVRRDKRLYRPLASAIDLIKQSVKTRRPSVRALPA